MYAITVIPIQKGFLNEYLTYFSSENIPIGYIVVIPIKNKKVDAIVINSEELINLKTDLKKADFQLKKILDIKGPSPFSDNFFKACEKIKDYNISNTSTIINNLIPKIFLENLNNLEKEKNDDLSISENIKPEKLIFQASYEDRISSYRTLIREAFAKKESIFICLPTFYDIKQYEKELSKGIEKYVYIFHSNLNKKTIINNYNLAIKEEHPILIISTGSFLLIPKKNIKTIIIENESSEAYKQISRPYVDIRIFAEILSSFNKNKLIFGDTILRPDTLWRHDNGELGEIASPTFRLNNKENQFIIDMKEEINEKGLKSFSVLSNKTIKLIDYATKNKESIFLFSVRKGLAGITICNDCGNSLTCPDCQIPLVLYGPKQRNANIKTTNRIFMCNKCGKKIETEIRCNNCDSWNLTPMGIGTDRIYEEVSKLFPTNNIIQIDKETINKESEVREAILKFEKNPGSILIGTEMAFYYLNQKVDHSVIVSLDGLLSIPSFNITQKVLHLFEKLNNLTKQNFIIQTRIPNNKIIKYILGGNILPLIREDLEERKLFNYPPFKKLIKITFMGSPALTEKARNFIDEKLKDYDPQIFSAFVSKIKGQYITNTVIKIDSSKWPIPTNENKKEIDKDLLEKLKNIPPSFFINVEPEDLL